jgi:hypothetical protein
VAERREGGGGEQRAVQQRCAREQALPAFAAYRLCLPVRPADTATYKRFADLAQHECVFELAERTGFVGRTAVHRCLVDRGSLYDRGGTSPR